VEALEGGAHWAPAFQATIRNNKNTQRFTIDEGQALR
jgi:hypothetical protein